jgi:hypothetical protein
VLLTQIASLGEEFINMSYFEQKKLELEQLLSSIRSERGSLNIEKYDFNIAIKQEREKRDQEKLTIEKLKEGVTQMAKERQIGFPWLADAYDELFAIQEDELVNSLITKQHPAASSAEIVSQQSKLRRQAEREKKIAQHLVKSYESFAPFLIDLKEEVDIGTDEERELLKGYSEEELQDETTKYLSKEEYRKLPSVERNQRALDRYWQRPKSNSVIGRNYERYIGYKYEEDGYDVEYHGIFKGFEDLTRDLICKKRDKTIIIQCKNWAKWREIFYAPIFQFFGSVYLYRFEHSDEKVDAVFYTSTNFSDLAREFSKKLGIVVNEKIKMDIKYPCIKCNINQSTKEKIYHLPFDQQYDKTKIIPSLGESYCFTVKEAEDAGFRRAFRWHNPEYIKK